ncbi:hypothetical protein [Paracoccus sp. TOH]|uniref:hypothetical protein n=1 Tax=Paracoccus sp. TOH TaxID=1263728 RepID=UPI0025B0E5CF|nr:hypothetical protein [Paracoccus sp. TOH]WJS83887.1 hypothetical protein NBE95_08940 [Paracoccus sp. TOH]
MGAVVTWGGRLVLGALGVKLLSDGEEMTENLKQAAPWIVAGVAIWYISVKGR